MGGIGTMDRSAETEAPGPRRWVGGGCTKAQSLYLTLAHHVSGQQRPSAAADFPWIGPKHVPEASRAGFSAWIHADHKRERPGEGRRRELSGGR